MMHTSHDETALPGDGLLLDARGLVKHYEGFSLDGVDVSVAPGEIVGFIGKNGAGKSTTLKAILGLVALDGGEARVLGATPTELSRTAKAAVKERIGVVFDTVAVPQHLTVRDVGRLMGRCYDRWDARLYARYLDAFALDGSKAVRELSRGMGMKLGLACALAHTPDLLLLDEATAGLDPMARDEVLDLLREFVADGRHGILMSSHITTDLDKAADRVVCIDAGRVVFSLAKDEITDMMGIARCRTAEFERIASSGLVAEGDLRYLRHEYGIDLLVPDRYEFARRFPDVPCDRMTIDDYMALTLKGGARR